MDYQTGKNFEALNERLDNIGNILMRIYAKADPAEYKKLIAQSKGK